MALNLSKSKYCSAVQCPKMLWLKKNKPEVYDDSVMNQSILETGNEVGDLLVAGFHIFDVVLQVDTTDFGVAMLVGNDPLPFLDGRINSLVQGL